MTEPKYGDALATERQRAIFDFIEAYQREHGIKPTIRQIAEEIGVNSLGTVQHHLEQLKRQGALWRKHNSSCFGMDRRFSKGVFVTRKRITAVEPQPTLFDPKCHD